MLQLSDSPIGALLRPEIEELVRARKFTELRDTLSELTPVDIADILRVMEPEERAVAFRVLSKAQAADIFEYLPGDEQEELLHRLGQAEVADILNEMAPDDRTALLEELPGSVTQRLIANLSPNERSVAQKLLGYPEKSIGRRMTPDYVALKKEWSLPQAYAHIRKVGKDSETLNVVYVTDEHGKLIDDIRLRDFVLAPETATVADLMDERFVALHATDDQELAVEAFKKYDRSALPVVDSAETLVGIVTVDDVLDVAEQEDTEDVQKMAGMEALDAPYMEVTLWEMLKKRGGWLSALFLGEMLTASAMTHYQAEIDRATVLSLFLPLIISSGGNSGSQGSTLVIRSMALRELSLGDWWRVMRRELQCGLLLGIWLGFIGFVRIQVWQIAGWADYTKHFHLVAATVFAALIGVVLWGTIVGSMLPFLLRRIKLDPAAISAPLVATMVDVCGLIIYFTVAMVILNTTLLKPIATSAPASAPVSLTRTVDRVASEADWQANPNFDHRLRTESVRVRRDGFRLDVGCERPEHRILQLNAGISCSPIPM